MKKIIMCVALAVVMGTGINVMANCGGCGTAPAKKGEVKKAAPKSGCPMAKKLSKLKLTDDQKKKVDAVKAEFMKKMEGILTADQMKQFKANGCSKAGKCGTSGKCGSAKAKKCGVSSKCGADKTKKCGK